MKFLIRTTIVAAVFGASSAFAVDPQLADITCEQLGEKYELTAEAEERFADLRGSCEGVYEVDGHLYTRTQAIIRSKRGGKVRLYLPATGHTFEITPDPSGRVWVGSRKMRVRDLSRGDELGIYISVDKFAQEKIDEIAFVTPEEHAAPIVIAPAEQVEALPTTASPLPLLALLSAFMLGFGLMLRRKV